MAFGDLPSVRSFSDWAPWVWISKRDIPEKVNKTDVEHTVIQCFTNLFSSRKATPPDFGLPPFLGAPVGWWMCKKRGITNQLFLEISYLLQNEYVYICIMFNEQYHILVNGESYFSNIIGKHIWYFIGFGGTLCSNNPHGNATQVDLDMWLTGLWKLLGYPNAKHF